ncbi:MAG: glycosyltransferase family 4 protein [Opitutales bacterium]|nr:glycosyltransferase family 4 protein [Opitutales bacterium]
MKSQEQPHIAVIGTQGQQVISGPGTFMRYLCQSVEEGTLSADIIYPHSREGTAYADQDFVKFVPGGKWFYNRFPGSWLITCFLVFLYLLWRGKHRAYSAIWFADRFSTLFCVFWPPLRRKAFAMVNDDTKILNYEEKDLDARKGFRKRLACFNTWFLYATERLICRKAAITISNSDYLSQKLIQSYGLDPARVHRLYKAVDFNRFAQVSKSPQQFSGCRILFVKNEWFRGGLDILLMALEELDFHDVHLRIIGLSESDLSSDMRAKIEQLRKKKTVEIMGIVDREKIPEQFSWASIFCVPSRREALGVAFMEALASGTACIGPKTGGVPEVMAHGKAGWLVPPGDAIVLKKTIEEILSDTHEAEEKIKFGLVHVQEFSKDKMIANIKTLTQKYFHN